MAILAGVLTLAPGVAAAQENPAPKSSKNDAGGTPEGLAEAPIGAPLEANQPAGSEAPAGTNPAAPEQPGSASEADPLSAVSAIVEAARSGNWRLVAAGALALAMLALRRLRDRVALFRGDRGGTVLVGVLALGGAFASALATSAPIDFKLILGAFGIAWTAVGGYTFVKKLLWPAR